MLPFLILLLISLTGAIAIAAAINYFLQTGFSRAFGYGLIAAVIFMVFAASGLWANSSRHDWGVLAPVFALMLVGGFIGFIFGKRLWNYWQNKKRGQNPR